MDDLFLILVLVSFICFIISIVKPSVFNKFFKEKKSRKNLTLFFLSNIIICFFLFGITTERIEQTNIGETSTPEKSNIEINNQDKNTGLTEEEIDSLFLEKDIEEETQEDNNEAIKAVEIESEPIIVETVSQKNAIRKANTYLNVSGFSKNGLIEQLEFEGFSNLDSTYAVNNIDVNWNEQAEIKANTYLNMSGFSRTGLIEQLEFEGFTNEQAVYGVNAVGL